jgi:hypothetical protein
MNLSGNFRTEPPASKVIYKTKNSYLTQYSNYQKQFIHPWSLI